MSACSNTRARNPKWGACCEVQYSLESTATLCGILERGMKPGFNKTEAAQKLQSAWLLLHVWPGTQNINDWNCKFVSVEHCGSTAIQKQGVEACYCPPMPPLRAGAGSSQPAVPPGSAQNRATGICYVNDKTAGCGCVCLGKGNEWTKDAMVCRCWNWGDYVFFSTNSQFCAFTVKTGLQTGIPDQKQERVYFKTIQESMKCSVMWNISRFT